LCGKGPEVHGLGGSPDTKYLPSAIVPVVYEFSDGRMSAAWGGTALTSVKAVNGISGSPMPEPRQVVLQGQPATVVASGQCLVTASLDKVPAEQRSVTLGLHGIELSFAPVRMEGDSLRLTVEASTGPASTGRHTYSTVAVREGQTLAVAGMLPAATPDRDASR